MNKEEVKSLLLKKAGFEVDKPKRKHKNLVRSRRSKTNFARFDDIPKNLDGNGRVSKRQVGHLCPCCFKKRSEYPGVVCNPCNVLNRPVKVINGLEEDHESL